jgi:hypothetical protein
MSEQKQVYVSGLYLNRVSEKAPEWVITSQTIHVEKLIDWLQKNKGFADDKGYIKITGKESGTKDEKGFNKRYFEINLYKPKKEDSPF